MTTKASTKHRTLQAQTSAYAHTSLSSWKDFLPFVESHLPTKKFVYRGQGDCSWRLESSLRRLFRTSTTSAPETAHEYRLRFYRHAEAMRKAAIGRGKIPIKTGDSDKIFSIGQHYGLATPLIDFTETPLFALFFAFSYLPEKEPEARTVFAYRRIRLSDQDDTPTLIWSTHASNKRIQAQRGLFLDEPIDLPIEEWSKLYKCESKYVPILWKIDIKSDREERDNCLRYLKDVANITALNLFPDLEGASMHANIQFVVDKY